jgi:phosphoribosylformylglycinamidine synthase subunit PurS
MKSETCRNLLGRTARPGSGEGPIRLPEGNLTPSHSEPPQKRLTYNQPIPMKAYVYVSLKKTVLDPQGKTIQGALKKMGYQGLGDVRQGKFFEIALNGGLTREQAHAEVEKMAREVLTNPVIEEFRFTVEA